MSYIQIGPHTVFLSTARHKLLSDRACEGKDAEWIIGSFIEGIASSDEKWEIMRAILQEEFRRDSSAFAEQWGKFDVRGDQAALDTWDLLRDWCELQGFATLSDMRDDGARMLANYVGTSFNYPMGKTFYLNHQLPNPSRWKSLTSDQGGRTVSVAVETEKVWRLSGTLEQFVVWSSGLCLICSKDFRVVSSVNIHADVV